MARRGISGKQGGKVSVSGRSRSATVHQRTGAPRRDREGKNGTHKPLPKVHKVKEKKEKKGWASIVVEGKEYIFNTWYQRMLIIYDEDSERYEIDMNTVDFSFLLNGKSYGYISKPKIAEAIRQKIIWPQRMFRPSRSRYVKW